MTILCIDHVTIRTDRATETVRFYEIFIGLKTGPRPDFGVPGHWLYAGDRPVVHIIGDDARSDALPAGSGRTTTSLCVVVTPPPCGPGYRRKAKRFARVSFRVRVTSSYL